MPAFSNNLARLGVSLKWRDMWSAILLPCAMLACAMAGICFYAYDAGKAVVREDVARDLAAIAKLKAGQIEQWMQDQRDDARLMTTSQFSNDLQHWLDGGMHDKHLKQRLLDQLQVQGTRQQRTFSLRSPHDGRSLLSAHDTPNSADTQAVHQLAMKSAMLGKVLLEDIRMPGEETKAGETQNQSNVDIGFFSPIFSAEGKYPQALLHIRMNPEEVLFPLVETWPGASASAETMLLRKEKDKVIYLSALRHLKHAASPLSKPPKAAQIIAARVISEGAGFFEDNDYRGVPCLGYGLQVPGTPWVLVAKIDRAEAYRQLNTITTLSAAMLGALLLASAWWLFERKRVDLLLRSSLGESEDLYQNAPCGYHSLDKNGIFVQINETHLEMLGYTREEIIGKMNIRRLLTKSSLSLFQQYFPVVIAFEPIKDIEFELIRKDGSIMRVLVSASAIGDRDGNFLMTRTMIYDLSERNAMEDQLRRSEESFRSLFRSIRDQVFVRASLADGAPGRLVEVNDVACEQLGYSREELLSQSPFHLYPKPPSGSELDKFYQQLAQGGNVVVEQTQQTKDGRLIPVEISATQLILHGQTLRVALVRDISERKQNEETLRLLQRAIESSANGLLITAQTHDSIRRIIYANPAFEQITGYSAKDVLGKTPQFLLGNEQDQPALAELYLALKEQRSCEVTVRSFRKDGSPFWNEILVSPVLDKRGTASHYVCSISDATSRMAIEAELLESREQLRKLAIYGDNRVEEERKHIARELHDELGQLLTVLKMNISLLQMQFDEVPGLVEKTEDMRILVENTIGVVRNTVSHLRPPALDMGIVGALEWLAEDYTRHTGLNCSYEGDVEDPGLEEKIATVVFRVAQESLTNVMRHAYASSATIALAARAGQLRMVVEDDGCGFDPMGEADGEIHFGLLGMRERVRALDGNLQIDSSPGQGTRIIIELPLRGRDLQ